MAFPAVLDRITALDLGAADRVTVHGLVSTAVDGSAFDAAFTWDGLTPDTHHPGGLFDAAAGGLRLVEQHVDRHDYVFAPTGTPGPACAAAGVPSPCLVPRLASLAHDRLKTVAELGATLSGSIAVDADVAAPPPAPTGSGALVLAAVALVVAVACAVQAARRRARTPLGRVRSAARAALRALHGDVSRASLRDHVVSMVGRAVELEKARRACGRRLRAIDRSAIARRREASALANVAGSGEAQAWLDEESREAAQLENDVVASGVGIERIESALRVIGLRLREHRGVPVRALRSDPVDAAARELATRDEAIAETEAVLDSSICN